MKKYVVRFVGSIPACLFALGLSHRREQAASVEDLHRELGITNYNKLPRQSEATELVNVGGIRMTPETRVQWLRMQKAAADQGVSLVLFDGFRSIHRQADVIRHLLKSRALDKVLEIAAAPGHSEHHTGRALDISTAGMPSLNPAFENTAAFRWLSKNAKDYGFTLSYPRDNPYGIAFEPWHWYYQPR